MITHAVAAVLVCADRAVLLDLVVVGDAGHGGGGMSAEIVRALDTLR